LHRATRKQAAAKRKIPPVAPKKEPINSGVIGSFLFPKTHFVTHLDDNPDDLRKKLSTGFLVQFLE